MNRSPHKCDTAMDALHLNYKTLCWGFVMYTPLSHTTLPIPAPPAAKTINPELLELLDDVDEDEDEANKVLGYSRFVLYRGSAPWSTATRIRAG